MFISVSSLAPFEVTCMCEYTYVPILKVCPIDEGVFFDHLTATGSSLKNAQIAQWEKHYEFT